MVVPPPIPRGHVVSFTIQAWGHAKAACTLITKIVRFGKVHATVFTANQFYDRIKKEVANNFEPGAEDEIKELIRVVGLESALLPTPANLVQLTEGFLDGYKRLCASQPIKALAKSDVYYSAIAPPQLVIMDFFAYDAMQGVRQVTAKTVPVYAMQSVSAAALLFLWGPEDVGGGGDLSVKLGVITHTDDKAIADEADKIYRRIKGELLSIPGIPPMYDHEFSPQKSSLDFSVAFMNARAHRFFLECDGAVMNTTPLLEKEAIDAVRQWFSGRPVICPAPFDYPVIQQRKDESSVTLEVEAFLNAALMKHGPHSVIYMSFGTAWWTTEPEKVWAALDVIIESRIPLLFSLATPFADIPEEVERKVKQSGIGYMSKWLPQTSILHHEACGWFVTHCGHNSVMEALTEGVPLICWPFDVDQPVNAALVTHLHDIGYELFETRSWHGLKPIHRLGNQTPEGTVDALRCELREVLSKAFGIDGKLKRENAQKLREKLSKSWSSDGAGQAWMEIKRIVDVLQRQENQSD